MFYENVKDLCALNRTNITQLARDLGISTSLPTKWKNGAIPRFETLKLIADHFGVTTDLLLSERTQSATVGDISNSAILKNVTAGNINITSTLSDHENELLNVYRSLPMRTRIELLQYAYNLHDKVNQNE